MKIFKFMPIFALLLLIGSSCKEKDVVTIQPACTDVVDSEVKLDAQFMGSCTKFFEGGASKNMKVEINVDGFAFDPVAQTVTVAYGENYEFPKPTESPATNDSNTPLSPVNRAFPIKLPRCGSYFITVIVRGVDGTCFKCCNNTTTFSGTKSCSGTGTGNGTVRWRVMTTKINSSLSTPPPSRVNVQPLPEKCTGCGC